LLGWLFDGFELGLFPVVARPALIDLLGITGRPSSEQEILIANWNGLTIAGFLVGAATGGVLFGWLGDRLGRVRAMSLSILTYALCSGAGAITTHPWQIVVVRFVAALGMGGEWSLGVALVMEVWAGKSRALLAGLIGSAANLGFALVAVISYGIQDGFILRALSSGMSGIGITDAWVAKLSANSAWRLLMVMGTLPALLTFFIRIFVPESQKWEDEKRRGTTSSWATQDLAGVFVGAAGGISMLVLWSPMFGIGGMSRLFGTVIAFLVITGGYLFPIHRYLKRSASTPEFARQTLSRMALGACLSGVALLGTWASIQWATTWVDQLEGRPQAAKQYTQFCSAMGAVISSIIAPIVGDWLGRRATYVLLCLGALGATLLFYQGNTTFGPWFLISVFIAGGMTATFYGWLPLYLPELFPTRVRATGQGFSFNFGRVIAAMGALQTASLMAIFRDVPSLKFLGEGYPLACSVMSLVYLVGLVVICFAPETKGQPLPE
jgi:MFS family permease